MSRISAHRGIAIAFLAAQAAAAHGADLYVAQHAAGADTGADPADAHALAWLNTAGNWGAGPGQIGPGTTVHLCGTISARIDVLGSGTADHPITIRFEAGAKMSAPVFPAEWWGGGAISIDRQDYITIDGGTDGLIECTANGTGLANQVDSLGVGGANANHLTVKNLTIRNLYVRTGRTDQLAGSVAIQDRCTRSEAITGFTATNNTIDHAATGICTDYGVGVSEIEFSYNTITHVNWGMNIGDRHPGATATGVYVHHNHVSLFSNWDDDIGNHYHHNGFYGWAESGGALSRVRVYANTIGPDFGTYATSGVFFSGNVSDLLVCNNVFVENVGDAPTNGLVTMGPSPGNSGFRILNNTFIGRGGGIPAIVSGTNHYEFRNNLIKDLAVGVFFSYTNSTGTLDSDYNLFSGLNPDGDQFVESPNGNGSFYNRAAWQAKGYDAHSVFADPLLDADGRLLAGSPAIGAGVNLTGAGEASLDLDHAGNPRPASGAWDIGAYRYPSASSTGGGGTGGGTTTGAGGTTGGGGTGSTSGHGAGGSHGCGAGGGLLAARPWR